MELAEKLVELSGLNRDQIPIEYIGIRPGEKIEEELTAATETVLPSPHPKIFRLDNRDSSVSVPDLRELEELIRKGQMTIVFDKMKKLINTGEKRPLFLNL